MLILAATPIGNLGDVSQRLRDAIEAADVIAAEDTRSAVRLLTALGIDRRPALVSMHEHNEQERALGLVESARDADVLVLSDAGMPTISDPGYLVVRRAIEEDVAVTVIPGPSAVTSALAVSGLPTDRFSFEGFVPRKVGERRGAFARLARQTHTLIFFESPRRLPQTLLDGADAFGADRPAVVCRELTKIHEEVRRGTLEQLAQWAENGVRGEIVVLIGGFRGPSMDVSDVLVQVAQLRESGVSLRDAVSAVASDTGVSRRELYEAALRSP